MVLGAGFPVDVPEAVEAMGSDLKPDAFAGK